MPNVVVTKPFVSVVRGWLALRVFVVFVGMKSRLAFRQVSRMLMDSWISSPDEVTCPESVYNPVRRVLRPNMILVVVDTRSEKSEEFCIDFIKRYDLPSGFSDLGLLQRRSSFAEFRDQKYLLNAVVPAYVASVDRQRPKIGTVWTQVFGMVMAYDQIILPQRNSAGRSSWCIGLLDVHFLLAARPRAEGFDDVEICILQLLAEGQSTKEIADALALSCRTIEHRIERLKSRLNAKNIAHLVAISISAGLSEASKTER